LNCETKQNQNDINKIKTEQNVRLYFNANNKTANVIMGSVFNKESKLMKFPKILSVLLPTYLPFVMGYLLLN